MDSSSISNDQTLQNKALLLLAAYFLLQLIIRLSVGPGLERDEAEQLLLTQQFSFGYGSQPPLYTWLQLVFFSLFGINVFAMALLKNILLFCTYWFTYKISRELGYSVVASIAAMLSILFIPQIVWESQRDLTHSVIVTTLTAATVLSWVRLKNSQTTLNYIVVGLCCGLGLLSKYNYGIFFLGLVAASLTIPQYRSLLLGPRIFISIATALGVVLPHAIWAITHLPRLLHASGKLKLAAEGGYMSSIIQGTGSLFAASLTFSALVLLIYLIVWYRYKGAVKKSALQHRFSEPNLILRSIIFSLLICLLLVFILQVTAFKDRWMQPMLFLLPVALLPLTQGFLTYQRGRLFQMIAAGMAVFILTAFMFRVAAAPYSGVITNLNMPYTGLVEQMEKQALSCDLILSQTSLMGGHLKLKYPSARVAIPGTSGLYHNSSPESVLVVWEKGENWQQDNRLKGLVKNLLGDRYSETSSSTVQQNLNYLSDKSLAATLVRLKRIAKN